MIEIKELLANKANYGNQRSVSNIKYIVIHYTANDGDTAINNCKYFKNNITKSSANYFVDDTSIYRSVPDNYIPYSVGGSKYPNTKGGTFYGKCTNSNSLNIELCDCYRNGVYDFTNKTITNAIDLVREKMKEYNIPIDNVIRHYDVTGKICPKPFVENENMWNTFKNSILNNISKWKQGDKVVVTIPIKIAYNQGDKWIVDSNGYQFWIHKSVIENNDTIHALGTVCYCGGDTYIIQVFNDQFWCKDIYISNP